jgi:hypothetical protein
MSAILSVVSHSIWPARAILGVSPRLAPVGDSVGIMEGPWIALGANTRRAPCEQRELSVFAFSNLGVPVARDPCCPVSLDLVHPHLADLRRTTSGETPFSGLSHLIWSARAVLSAVSHLIWSARGILSAVSH